MPAPATPAAAGATHLLQTPSGTLRVKPSDRDSLAQLTLATRNGRRVAFTPVSLDSSGQVLLVSSVRPL